MKVKFTPDLKYIDSSAAKADEFSIKNEPMIYGGSWEWCRENGGALTNIVMDKIEDSVLDELQHHALLGYHPVIDTKSVLLMPGQYPCIPGWHCDGVIRQSRGAQPNLETIDESIFHYFCSFCTGADLCGTEIIMEEMTLDVDKDDVWGSVDSQINDPISVKLKSGEIARFSRSTLHRGTSAEKRCWRYFFRLSFYHMPAMNEIRNQVQIYTDVSQGW